MTEAKLKAEQCHTDYLLQWTPPEALEQEVILALIKAVRQDAMAHGIEGMTSWDTTRMYTTETLAVMPVQKGIVDDRGWFERKRAVVGGQKF